MYQKAIKRLVIGLANFTIRFKGVHIMIYSKISKNILFSVAIASLLTAHDVRPMDNKKLPMLGAFLGGVALCGIGQYLWKRFIYKMPKNHFHGVYINAPVDGSTLDILKAQVILDTTNGPAYMRQDNGNLERISSTRTKANNFILQFRNHETIYYDPKNNKAWLNELDNKKFIRTDL